MRTGVRAGRVWAMGQRTLEVVGELGEVRGREETRVGTKGEEDERGVVGVVGFSDFLLFFLKKKTKWGRWGMRDFREIRGAWVHAP